MKAKYALHRNRSSRCKFLRFVPYGVLWLILLGSCQQKVEHGGKTPLVQVAGRYLYLEDLNQVFPFGISSSDSVQFAKDFMRKWIEEQLLYEKAEHNVRGDERIERMVADYRRTLILNRYEQYLISQKMNEELSEAELLQYYEENKQLFILEEPIITSHRSSNSNKYPFV